MSAARTLLGQWLLALVLIVRVAAIEADDAEIRVAGQAHDGGVWAVGARDRPAVFRWREDRWETNHAWNEWPGNVIDIAADPSRPDTVLTLWFGVAGDGGLDRTLQLWRHTPEGRPRRVEAFPNPTVQDARWGRSLPRLSVDPAGGAWLTFAAPVVLHVPASGGSPRRFEIPLGEFAPIAGKEITEILPLRFSPDGADSGWVWSVDDDTWSNGRGALFRPRRIADGVVGPAPMPDGLPKEGRVVLVTRDHAGRMVWSLEDQGLWRISPAGSVAEPVDSPPGVWRILDWREWPDGRAVALVFSKRSRRDRLRGEIWARRPGSAWMNLGPSGDTSSRVLRVNSWVAAARDWNWEGERLLGAGFYAGLVAADLGAETPACRPLDWRDGQTVAGLRRMFSLPDGRLLLQGATTRALSSGEIWKGKARADAAEDGGGESAAWTFSEAPVRAPDGRLWILRPEGIGAPAVRHWDGARWWDWPLPPERSWWPRDALWVDAAGRVAVFSDNHDAAAWELEGPGGAWRRWASGKALIEARASERPCVESLPVVEEQFARSPVLSSDGRALVGTGGGGLWYLAEGAWRLFGRKELGTTASKFGFSADDGRAWFFWNGHLYRLDSEARWVEAPERPEAVELTREQQRPRTSHSQSWQEKIGPLFDRTERVSTAHPDETGAWWAVAGGELWRVVGAEKVAIFGRDEPSPFRLGRGWSSRAVLADARGGRLFVGSPHVLLPGLPVSEPMIAWEQGLPAWDRRAEVTGAGLVAFEWRMDDGPWRREAGATLALRELPPGRHRLEVRGVNGRSDAGPAVVAEWSVDYDRAERVGALIRDLDVPGMRGDAVARLRPHGGEAEAALRAALAREPDEGRRWWLRAALQAVEDGREMRASP